MSVKPRALVIGAGVAGPATALFLARAGYEPAVFESYPGRASVGGALAIAPNGMSVMGELGLADRVVAAGSAVDGFGFRTKRGRALGSMAYGPAGRYRFPAVSLSRNTFYGIVLDALEKRGTAPSFGKRLEAIEQDDGGITARFADGSAERGDILVGADGIHSAVRRLVLADAPQPAFTGLIGAGGFLPRRAFLERVGARAESTIQLFFGEGAFFGCAPGDRREVDGAYWWHALARERPLTEAEREALTGEAGVAELMRAGDGWCALVRDVIAATTTHIAPLDLFDVASLPRWHAGRAILVGDAAHAVSPHSGQGASMALEDAIALAKALRAQPDQPAAAFASFEAARRPRAERVVAMGRRSGDQKRHGRLASWLQTLIMPLALRLMPAPRWLYGFEARWAD